MKIYWRYQLFIISTWFMCLYIENVYAQQSFKSVFSYINPIKTEAVRDPNIHYVNGRYYMTGTAYPFFEQWGQNPGVKLWSSDDLLHWDFESILVKPAECCWYRQRFWAPEIFPYKHKFYLTFNCIDSAYNVAQAVGLAVADSITGPYKVLTQDTSLCEGNDADLFEDDDGKVYLFTSGIFCRQISLPDAKLIGEVVQVLQPGNQGTWDGGKGVGIEGPGVIKINGVYYLFYSSWGRGYEVGYATASSITGIWTKNKTNPVYGAQNKPWAERFGNVYTQSPDVPFTEVGHGQPFKKADGSWWLSSHGIKPGRNTEPQLVIDPIYFTADSKVHIKLTWTKQVVNTNSSL